jgi:hypothetical protein
MSNTFEKASSLREAVTCFLMGARSAGSPRALLCTVLLWVAALLICVLAFAVFWDSIEAASVAATQAVFERVGSWFGTTQPAASGGTGPLASLVGGLVNVISGVVLMGVLFFLSLVVVARVLAELVLMNWVQGQALRAYRIPKHPAPLKQGFFGWSLRNVRDTWGLLIVSPILLLTPFLGIALFALLLAYLNARFLLEDALSGTGHEQECATLARTLRLELLAIGLLSALVSIVPLMGLLSPWATGSAVCHLTYRRLCQHGSS